MRRLCVPNNASMKSIYVLALAACVSVAPLPSAQTDSTIMITSQDGRTTRLSPDGKKIKDDSTKIERKTKWDAGKLVSEIKGAGPGKMTQTFAVDPETHKLRITVQMEGRNKDQAR